jgi:hypothetical protein
MVVAVVPTGKKAGTYKGRVAVRSRGFFNIATKAGTVQGISHKYCRVTARACGYSFNTRKGTSLLPTLKDGASAP